MLDIVVRQTCASNVSYAVDVLASDEKTWYRCSYGKLPAGEPYAYGWTCGCKAYQFGKRNGHGLRTCKHVQGAEVGRCGYGIEAFTGDSVEVTDDGTCPKCHGPMVSVKVGI